LAERIFPGIGAGAAWDHAAAQRYELESARNTIFQSFARVYAEWESYGPALSFGVGDQWFRGNASLYAAFRDGIEDRAALEIGSGPFGHLAPCKAFKRRIIIDPLALAYRDMQQAEFGKTFFTPDIELHATAAEVRIPELAGAIDGLIVSRNAIDHCDDPLAVLGTIAEYAAPGCWFFLWTDIWHLAGLDAGHRNITRSASVMQALIEGLGFEVIQRGATIRNPAEYIEFGCIARKQ